MDKFGLPDRTINELLEYFRTKPEIEKVVIFGSRAKGTYKNGSDIDFAILTDNHKTFYRYSAELDELPTPYKFDVIDFKTLTNPNMLNSINTDGKLFYSRVWKSVGN